MNRSFPGRKGRRVLFIEEMAGRIKSGRLMNIVYKRMRLENLLGPKPGDFEAARMRNLVFFLMAMWSHKRVLGRSVAELVWSMTGRY